MFADLFLENLNTNVNTTKFFEPSANMLNVKVISKKTVSQLKNEAPLRIYNIEGS
jgi:hypothetical protein